MLIVLRLVYHTHPCMYTQLGSKLLCTTLHMYVATYMHNIRDIIYCSYVMSLGDTEARQDYYYRATPYLAYTDRRGMDKSRGVTEGSYLS